MEIRPDLQEHHERMLTDTPVIDPTAPIMDGTLRYNTKEYLKLIIRLDSSGILQWTLKPTCHVGLLLSVDTGEGARRRLIIDAAWPANRMFKPPPLVELPEDVLCDNDATHAWFGRRLLVFGLAEVKDRVERFRIPRWLSQYLALLAVPAWVAANVCEGMAREHRPSL